MRRPGTRWSTTSSRGVKLKLAEGTSRTDLYATLMQEASDRRVSAPDAEGLRKELANKQAEADPSTVQVIAPQADKRYRIEPGDAPSIGPAQAQVVVVEFMDFQCPYCRRAWKNELRQLVEKRKGEVKFAVRNLPLAIHPSARGAAVAALAAHRQGKFWEYHQKLLDEEGEVGRDVFVAFASELGLDKDKFLADLDDPAVAEQVRQDMTLAVRVGVTGTPGFFVNGRYSRGYDPGEVAGPHRRRARKREEDGGQRCRGVQGLRHPDGTGRATQGLPQPVTWVGLNRRRFMSALGAAALTGCKGGTAKLDKDPVYQGTRPTMEDVDDSLSALVTGDRVRVVYKPQGAIRGAAEPLVTIVEFSDFQCPFCGAFAQTLEEFLLAYPDDVRLVFMQFPLPMHPNAKGAAKGAIAAQSQNYFWSMHDQMFANRTKLGPEQLVEMAGDLGLDAQRFAADLDASATQERLEWEMAIGRRLGVRGTPSFFVNGRRRSGAMDPAALRSMIEEERTLARKLMDGGAERRAVYAHINRAAKVAGARPTTGEPSPASPG